MRKGELEELLFKEEVQLEAKIYGDVGKKEGDCNSNFFSWGG